MLRVSLAVCVLALGSMIAGCDRGQDNPDETTDTRRGERVFDPMVGALDRAHRLEDVAADHNRALDEALRHGEGRKEEQR